MMSQGKIGRIAILTAVALAVLLSTAGPAAAQFGRTQGGYGGAALGAVAGSAAGTALIAAAGIVNPLLSGTLLATSTLGAGFLGAKLGSKAGNTLDQRMDPSTTWTIVGSVTGSLMGFIFGPSGGMVGKVLGAGIGAALGGWAGNYLSGKANRDYNPRTIGALIGGVNGALMAGPLGAAAGIPLGYIGGNLLDKYVFSKGAFGDDRWGKGGGRPWDQGAPWDQGYNQGPWQKGGGSYPPVKYDGSGYDRQGYDRAGYDREKFDREGYDRFGYDRFGYDRDGFDRKGYKKVATGGPDGKPTYDPKTYNGYWQAYNQVGGDSPNFGKIHFDYYPDDLKSSAYDRYSKATPASSDTTAQPSADLVNLKQQYMLAVEKVQSLAKSGTNPTEYTEAMKKLSDLEAQLKEKMAQEGVSK